MRKNKKQEYESGVCFLLESFYPMIHGAAIQIQILGERLAKCGLNVIVITRQIVPEHPRYDRIKNIGIIRVKPAIGLKRIGKYLMMAPAFLALFRQRKKISCIMVCDTKVLGILGVVSSKILKKKCFLRAESCGEMDGSFAIMYENHSSKFRKLMIKGLVKIRNLVLFKADGFISICSAITREFLKVGVPFDKITVIPNGIEVLRFKPPSRNEKKIFKNKLGLQNKKNFIYTGRLAKGKGLEYLLRIWRTVVHEYPEAHLILVGSGQGYSLSCEDELKNFVKENDLEKSITFTGNVNNIDEFLKAGDYFVLPSKSEGLSISLLEALSCGLPCITTKVGGNIDIIDNNKNGLFIEYGNEEELLRSIRYLLKNREPSIQLGLEARKKVLKCFDIDVIVKRYISLFNKAGLIINL